MYVLLAYCEYEAFCRKEGEEQSGSDWLDANAVWVDARLETDDDDTLERQPTHRHKQAHKTH